jgi:hypothetical protein
MGDPFVACNNIGKLEEHPMSRIHPFEDDIRLPVRLAQLNPRKCLAVTGTQQAHLGFAS